MWLFVNSIVLTGSKDGLEEKSKAPVQKGPVLQKGRFSVTSDDGDLEGLQQQQQAAANLPLSSAAALTSASVPVVALMPHLQNALHLGIMQQVLLSPTSYVWSHFLSVCHIVSPQQVLPSLTKL
jgi:hypothetical protein